MPASRKALNRIEGLKWARVADSYAKAYIYTLYDVVYKPQGLLNGLASPVFVFMLKFLHPKMFLNRVKTKEFTSITNQSENYQLTSSSPNGAEETRKDAKPD